MLTDEQSSQPAADRSARYEVRINGHLSPQRTDWFEGLSVTLEEDGTTLLKSAVIDQSALHGILKKIRDLGMPLLSVNSVDRIQAAKTDSGQR